MKAIDKAKEKYSSLSKMDIIDNSCPDILGILESPSYCTKGIYVDLEDCKNCWNREVLPQRKIIKVKGEVVKSGRVDNKIEEL